MSFFLSTFFPCLFWNQLNSLKCVLEERFVPWEESYGVDGENYKGQFQAETNLQWVFISDIQVEAWLPFEFYPVVSG